MSGLGSCNNHVDLVQMMYGARNRRPIFNRICHCRHSLIKRMLCYEPPAITQWNCNPPCLQESTSSKKRSRRSSTVSKRSRRKVSSITSKRTKAAPSKASNRKKMERLSAIVLHRNPQFKEKCAQESGLFPVTNVKEQNHEQDNVKKVEMLSSTSNKNKNKTKSRSRKKGDLGKVNSAATIKRLDKEFCEHVMTRLKEEYVGEEYVDVGVQTPYSCTSFLGHTSHAN